MPFASRFPRPSSCKKYEVGATPATSTPAPTPVRPDAAGGRPACGGGRSAHRGGHATPAGAAASHRDRAVHGRAHERSHGGPALPAQELGDQACGSGGARSLRVSANSSWFSSSCQRRRDEGARAGHSLDRPGRDLRGKPAGLLQYSRSLADERHPGRRGAGASDSGDRTEAERRSWGR